MSGVAGSVQYRGSNVVFCKNWWPDHDSMVTELKIARLIMKAQLSGKAQNVLRVYDVGKNHVDYEVIEESWRAHVSYDNKECSSDDLDRLDRILRQDVTAADSIAQQLRELRKDCGIVYFDLHPFNIAKQAAEPHDWRIFDFDCSRLVKDADEYPSYTLGFQLAVLPFVFRDKDKGGRLARWRETNKEPAVLARFKNAWFFNNNNDDDGMRLRSGKICNGAADPAVNPLLQRAIATNDIDAMRYFYIFLKQLER